MSCVSILQGAALPAALSVLPKPPPALYVCGGFSARQAVAIVGTRKPSAKAITFAKALAQKLVEAGFVVASGGALGIDAAAHQGALEAGGQTWVIAPSGIERPYPDAHQQLYASILAQGGAYVSLVEPHVPASRPTFFQRNACLVALSSALIVVEAPLRSGARNAAKWARQLGRPLFVVPGAPWHSRSRGCLEELRLGASLLISVKDVLRALGSRVSPAAKRPKPALALSVAPQLELFSLDPVAQQVLVAVQSGLLRPDELCDSTGLSAQAVQRALFHLTLAGRIGRSEFGEVTVITQRKI